jgi:predicted MFS family arabinose efflux permease
MWFPRQRLPLVNGCATAFGSFGALSATVPVERLFEALGWRPIFLILAALTVAAIALIYFCVPERPSDAASGGRGRGGLAAQIRDLGLIYTSAFFWRVGLVTVVHNSIYLAYQSLWLGPWLRDVAGMPLPAIAQTMLWFNVGMFAGVLAIGMVADRLQKFGIRPIQVMGAGIALSIAMQAMFALEQTAMAGLQCLAFGFFGSSALLVYSILGQEFPVRLVGRVNTAANMLSFTGIFAVQWGVGIIINLWPELGSGRYDPAGHQAALIAMVGLEILAFVWFLAARHRGSGIPS